MMTTYLKRVQDNSSTETVLGKSSTRWGGLMKANDGGRCFYCGQVGHDVVECDDARLDVEAGLLRADVDGKLRLYNGDYIPNMPNAPTLRERVERYYAEKCGQYVTNEEKVDDDVPYVVKPSSPFSYASQYSYVAEDLVDREVFLGPVLNLEERQELGQYECEEGKKIYAPYVTIPELPSPFYYEQMTRRDLGPNLTEPLELQLKPGREKDPSQRWSDMEEDGDLPVDFATEYLSPLFFIHNDPVFRIDW
jgi:hypothetical protein